MNYKVKAFIQNSVARLPSPLDYHVYYLIQRLFGGLKDIDPFTGLNKCSIVLDLISRHGKDIAGKSILEVGTGRTLDFLIGLWLCGAERIITVDVNPYLSRRLVFESLKKLKENPDDIKKLFPRYCSSEPFKKRLNDLLSCSGNLKSLLRKLHIEYLSPADAASLDIGDNSIDYHVSISVFEHVPRTKLRDILLEAGRITKHNGLLVSLIDPSDHFSHSDKSITSVHFLQLTEERHQALSGNKFMYHNRLRASDYYMLFNEAGLSALTKEEFMDSEALEALRKGFPLNEKFREYDEQDLCVKTIYFVGRFKRENA